MAQPQNETNERFNPLPLSRMSHFSVPPPPLAKSLSAFSFSVCVGIQLKSERQKVIFFTLQE